MLGSSESGPIKMTKTEVFLSDEFVRSKCTSFIFEIKNCMAATFLFQLKVNFYFKEGSFAFPNDNIAGPRMLEIINVLV